MKDYIYREKGYVDDTSKLSIGSNGALTKEKLLEGINLIEKYLLDKGADKIFYRIETHSLNVDNSTYLVAWTRRLETDEEQKDRISYEEGLRAQRMEKYLELKREFEDNA